MRTPSNARTFDARQRQADRALAEARTMHAEQVSTRCNALSNCCPQLLPAQPVVQLAGFSFDLYQPASNPCVPPMTEHMIRRTPSPCNPLRPPVGSVFDNFTVEHRVTILDKTNTVYGVCCDDMIQLKRMPNNHPKDARAIFLVCPLGMDVHAAHTDLARQVQESNKQATAKNHETVFVHQSQLEIDGLQARFCIPIDRNVIHVEKIEIIVWGELDTTGTVNSVKIKLLGDIPYNNRAQVIKVIKDNRPLIVQSLPKFAKVIEGNYSIVENQNFDHYIGKHDANSIGLDYQYSLTHSSPKSVNIKRLMDPENPLATTLRTSLADDAVCEALDSTDPQLEGNVYTKFLENAAKSKTKITPNQNIDNILIQEESSIRYGFLDSSNMYEFKAREYRVDIARFNLPPLLEKELNTYSPIVGPKRKILETQKINKSLVNATRQIHDGLVECGRYYVLDPNISRVSIEQELELWYKNITDLGRIECNLLHLNNGNYATRCALEEAKVQVFNTQQEIINAYLQFNLHNGNPNMTRLDVVQIFDTINGSLQSYDLIDGDANSLEIALNRAIQLTEKYGLDRNSELPTISLIGTSPHMKSHIKSLSQAERMIVAQETRAITPLFHHI